MNTSVLLAAMGLILTIALAVLACSAYAHHRRVRSGRQRQEASLNEAAVLVELARLVDTAYSDWTSAGGQAFTGPLPIRDDEIPEEWTLPFDFK